jgi:hypothetical protein
MHSWRFTGTCEWEASMRGNVVHGREKGLCRVDFPARGFSVVFEMPSLSLSGIVWGERVANFRGTMLFEEVELSHGSDAQRSNSASSSSSSNSSSSSSSASSNSRSSSSGSGAGGKGVPRPPCTGSSVSLTFDPDVQSTTGYLKSFLFKTKNPSDAFKGDICTSGRKVGVVEGT